MPEDHDGELQDLSVRLFLLDDVNGHVDLSFKNKDLWEKIIKNINIRIVGASKIVNYINSVTYNKIKADRKRAISIVVKYNPIIAAFAICSIEGRKVINQDEETAIVKEYLNNALDDTKKNTGYLYAAIIALWIMDKSVDNLIENMIYVVDTRKDLSKEKIVDLIDCIKKYLKSLTSFEKDYPRVEYCLDALEI